MVLPLATEVLEAEGTNPDTNATDSQAVKILVRSKFEERPMISREHDQYAIEKVGGSTQQLSATNYRSVALVVKLLSSLLPEVHLAMLDPRGEQSKMPTNDVVRNRLLGPSIGMACTPSRGIFGKTRATCERSTDLSSR